MTNPELRRNLWLEITPHRLLAMPLVLSLVFFVVFAITDNNKIEALSWAGLVGFGLLTMVWGTGLAANSFVDELVEKTWDWQRLSTLKPWAMTWGKLLGSTVFAWYGGLLCLLVFVATAEPGRFGPPGVLALTLVCVAVLLHALTLAVTAHASTKNPPKQRSFLRLIGIFLALNFLLKLFFLSFTDSTGNDAAGSVQWWGFDWGRGHFLLVSSAVFMGWAVVGAYRSLCQALAVRTTPVMWLAFMAFGAFYTAGFVSSATELPFIQVLLTSGLIWSTGLTYLMLFTESTGPVTVRRVLRKFDLAQWRRVAEEIPCWPPSLLVAVVCAVLLMLVHLTGLSNLAAIQQMPWFGVTMPLSLVLLLVRDAGMLMFFNAAAKPRRVIGSCLVYILVLNIILPATLHAVGLDWLAKLVSPLTPQSDGWLGVTAALVQAVVAWWLAGWRIAQRLVMVRRVEGV